MKIAYLSPLPPASTGIAHYSAMLLPALGQRFDVTAFGQAADYERDRFDLAIYQLGNNPHHEWIYREAMVRPGIAVLHDLVLHHLIVEMTLARGDADAYVAALRENHGAAGAAWARGRAAGLHSEMGNFLMPASIALANRSRAVILHNRWAAERLRSFGVGVPIHVVPHPYVPEFDRGPQTADREEANEAVGGRSHVAAKDREAVRQRHGFASGDRVIGFFGFLTSAKRAEVVLEAFARARVKDARVKLLIVGEPAPNIDVDALRGEGIVTTGYVADDEFSSYYEAADRLVNLRYPTAGETSGTLVRAFDAGKPVAVSDYAQFADYPDECAVKIPFGEDEIDALADFYLRDLDTDAIARAQRQWLEQNATMELAVEGYAEAIEQSGPQMVGGPRSAVRGPEGITAALPLFVQMKLVGLDIEGDDIRITIRNTGEALVCTRSYGQPEYRIIAKLFEGDRQVEDRWLSLPGDIGPGETATISIPVFARRGRLSLRLYDGLQSIPSLDPKPWATAEIVL